MASKQKTTEAKAPVLKGQEGARPTHAYMRLTNAPPPSGGQGPRVHQDGEPPMPHEQLCMLRKSRGRVTDEQALRRGRRLCEPQGCRAKNRHAEDPRRTRREGGGRPEDIR